MDIPRPSDDDSDTSEESNLDDTNVHQAPSTEPDPSKIEFEFKKIGINISY